MERFLDINASHTAVNVTVNAGVRVDELRFYPAGALMTTYAYDRNTRLLRALSDEKSIPAEIEHDPLLRLRAMRDENRHYVQSYQYTYKTISTENNIRSRMALQSGVMTLNDLNNLSTNASVKRSSQHFDGLGRPVQANEVGQSPLQNDVITPMTYDAYGRETKKYLPYTIGSNGGALRSNAISEQSAFYSSLDGGFGYSESVLEDSPLSRVKESKSPGAIFRTRPRTTQYRTNIANEVRNFRNTGTTAYYAANSIYKVIETDENGNTMTLYTDKLGRKVMQNNAGAKTYYVYDDFGNLWAVVPPKATGILESNTNWTINSASDQGRIYKYNYDPATMLLSSKKIPNSNLTTYYYDRLDRPVMVQDGNGNKIFTKYDILGRPAMTGKYTGTATPNSSNGLYETRNTTAPHYYSSSNSFPTDANIQIYTLNYYDDYDIDGNGSLSAAENFGTVPAGYGAPLTRARGKGTVTKVAVLPANGSAPTQYLHKRNYLDMKGRSVQSKNENHLAGSDVTNMKYSFAGWLIGTHRVHTATPPGGTAQNLTIEQIMSYDHAGRLLKTEQKTGSETAFTTLSEQTYNERSLLDKKHLHKTTGGSFLQSCDYSYNIMGWLTAMNNTGSCSAQASNPIADLFSMTLQYESPTGATPQYNGNIAEMHWRTNLNGTCGAIQAYRFSYDALNRLTAASHWTNNGSWANTDNYSESSIQYDLSGNITRYRRKGLISAPSTFGFIDDMSYYYLDGNNPDRATRINESGNWTKGFKYVGSFGGVTYLYDANGNLTEDKQKSLTLAYNEFNLPRIFTVSNAGTPQTVEVVYDGSGAKLSKTVKNNGSTTYVQQYVAGIEYRNTAIEALYHQEGRLTPNGTAWHYEYSLKDHLGNARVSFRANGSSLTVLQENHYYS